MQLKTTKDIVENVYQVKLETQSFTAQETDLIGDFGDPLVQTGGTFDTGGANQFILPAAPRALQAGFPVLQTFDAGDFANAETRATIYASEMRTRILAVLATLRANVDDFSGITVETV